jgi:hypothetical protein
VDHATVGLVYGPWTYSMGLFFGKIKARKKPGPGNFTKTPLNFFEIIF